MGVALIWLFLAPPSKTMDSLDFFLIMWVWFDAIQAVVMQGPSFRYKIYIHE